MTFTGSIASIIPGTMALSTLGKSTQMIPGEYWNNGKKKTKKVKKVPMIKGFTEIMMSVPLIGATANLTSGL